MYFVFGVKVGLVVSSMLCFVVCGISVEESVCGSLYYRLRLFVGCVICYFGRCILIVCRRLFCDVCS